MPLPAPVITPILPERRKIHGMLSLTVAKLRQLAEGFATLNARPSSALHTRGDCLTPERCPLSTDRSFEIAKYGLAALDSETRQSSRMSSYLAR